MNWLAEVWKELYLIYQGRTLDYVCRSKLKLTAEVIGAKAVNIKLNYIAGRAKKCIPTKGHPWRRYVDYPTKGVAIPKL